MQTDFGNAIVWSGDSGFRGVKESNGVSSFWGIRYAKPPVGDLRFKNSVLIKNYCGLQNATKPGNISWQWIDDRPNWQKPVEMMSEDCLFLNVFTPSKSVDERLPVLFWIHGGASITGAGSDPVLNGKELAAKGVIVVTFNYRLGALGFLVHPELSKHDPHNTSGNYGVTDILTALEWVKRNISMFGGDANHIVMGGQSAGAGATAYLLASPLFATPLKGAIMMSTSPTSYPDIP